MSSYDTRLIEVAIQLSAEKAAQIASYDIMQDSDAYKSVITCKKDRCNGNAVQEHPLEDARDYICLQCGLKFKINPRGSRG